MRKKHNMVAELENKVSQSTLKNMTGRIYTQTEKISSSLRRRQWTRYVLQLRCCCDAWKHRSNTIQVRITDRCRRSRIQQSCHPSQR